MGHAFDRAIVRQYDMRGTYGDNLNEADATALGGELAELAHAAHYSTAVVGHDARHSSAPLYEALVEALAAGGMQVMAIGDCATPELYFAERHLAASIAVMVTGSHNPPRDNGFKINVGGGSFFGESLTALAARAAQRDPTQRSGGSVAVKEIRSSYISRLREEFGSLRPMRVAMDPANGALCWALRELIPHLPGEVILLNGEADGDFPSHHPDPTVIENLRQLRDVVLSECCDFGIGFDGDGDRLGVIDNKGEVLWGDVLLPLYAESVLSVHPGSVILADVKCGDSVFANIERLGGVGMMSATGHSIIKTRMREVGALLAGEMTGHIFFADSYYGYDDALYAGLRLWRLLGDSGVSLSCLRARYAVEASLSEVRMPLSESTGVGLLEAIKEYITEHYGKDDIILIDGVRVGFSVGEGRGWFLLRAAHTESVLSLRAAGSDTAMLAEAVARLRRVLEAFDLPTDLLG